MTPFDALLELLARLGACDGAAVSEGGEGPQRADC